MSACAALNELLRKGFASFWHVLVRAQKLPQVPAEEGARHLLEVLMALVPEGRESVDHSPFEVPSPYAGAWPQGRARKS